MLADLPASIFHNWHKHYIAEPWGYEFEMYRHSEVCTYLVNGLYNPKEPVKPTDFYPQEPVDDSVEKDDISEDKLIEILKGMTS